jgi:alkylation response protein AidB-like acyl-CoA dehydrogenase
MAFEFSDDQEEFRRTLRRFFQEKSPTSEVRRLMDTPEGYDKTVWSQLAGQLGIQGLIIPEEYGGSGYTFVELAIAFEEMGRVLFCAPCFSTIALATNALVQSGDVEAMSAYLPRIASGESIATLGIAAQSGLADSDRLEIQARPSGNEYLLDGRQDFVVDGHIADFIIVAGHTQDGVSLFAVEGDAAGLVRHLQPTADRTRKLAALEFTGTRAARIGGPGDAASVLTKTFQLASVALAAEQLGGAQSCLDMAVEYAKQRVQFGRAIGSFQAIKHACADMLLEVESARSAAYYAAWAVAEGSDEVPLVASLARAYCSDTYVMAASENLQIHGGIGFTWEVDCHLFIRRAKSSAVLLGSASEHRELVAQQLGL